MGTQTFHRGVLDAKLASWTSENTYGTAYDIKGIRNATINLVIDSDELGGDDVILDEFAVIEAVTIEWEQAAVDLEVLDMISGGTLVSDAAYEDLVLGRQADSGLPYFAFAFAVTGSDGHSLQVFVPKMKVEGNLQFQAQYKQYLLPGASLKGVYEGETNGVARWRKFASYTALEIPLRTTVGDS
jgi:hypothetical protein